jgi:hydroxymethylpyrimidine/phosphomethylpyrimidine kinase
MTEPELIPVEERPAVLTVAGLDPSGGAGLVTDAAVIRAFGLHPLTVLTSVVVENTSRVARRHDLPPAIVQEQLLVLSEEFLVGAVKAGMLANVGIVEALAAWLAERPRLPLVLDPVLRASSGGGLCDAGLADALKSRLLPNTRVLTPNLDEASALTGIAVSEREQVPDVAQRLMQMGPQWVLVKGGHLARGRAADYLVGPDTALWMEESRADRDVRGTGCALASAIASGLARGESVPDACAAAKAFITRSIETSYVAGQGRFLGGATRDAEE